MRIFSIDPVGPFTLDTFRDFECGCYLASRRDLTMAFPLDRTHQVVGVRVRARDDGRIEGTVHGPADVDVDAVRHQVARVLSLDHDARGFAQMCAKDRRLAPVYTVYPGFRPPVFYSPYVTAGWMVLCQRLRQPQAAAIQARLAEEAGDVAVIDGERLVSFPRPQTLLAMGDTPCIPEEKRRRLQAVAQAALDGELDVERLRAEPYEVARARLLRIHGVGDFTADAVLMRGTGLTDGVGTIYPMEARWSPWRTWTCVMLRMAGELGPVRATRACATTTARGRRPRTDQARVTR